MRGSRASRVGMEVGLVLLGLSSLPNAAFGISYAFTEIASTNDGFTNFGLVSINNQGTVVFAAGLPGSIPNTPPFRAVVTGNGGPLATIASHTGATGEAFGSISAFVSVSDAGVVAFQGTRAGVSGPGIYTGNGVDPITTIAEPGGAIGALTGAAFPAIGDTGVVAFRGLVSDGIGSGNLYTTSHGSTPALDATSISNNFFRINPESVRGSTVAFRATLDPSGSGGQGVYTIDASGGTVTTIAEITGSGSPFANFRILPPVIFFPNLTVNAHGAVVFAAALSAGGSGIFLGDGLGGITTIADTSMSQFATADFFTASLNDSGAVAFSAALASNRSAVFVAHSPPSVVIQSGDALLNSTVAMDDTATAVYANSFNNRGQIAFVATLANGVTGVFVATPVPEPGTAAVALSLLASLAAARARRD